VVRGEKDGVPELWAGLDQSIPAPPHPPEPKKCEVTVVDLLRSEGNSGRDLRANLSEYEKKTVMV
jgi:hypothetical protein